MFWRAWHTLRFDRQYAGMEGVPLPLPFSAIDAYARRYGIEGPTFEIFREIIQMMDAEYLEVEAERRPKQK